MTTLKWSALSIVLYLALVLLLSNPASAHPSYQLRIPNGKNVIGGKWPGMCRCNDIIYSLLKLTMLTFLCRLNQVLDT